MSIAETLRIRIFADGADVNDMVEMYHKPYIHGFTTNPTLMKAAGITDYEGFAKDILKAIPDRSISFEVFADDFNEMKRQALKIATWGDNVFVKIPVSNTRQESSYDLIQYLSARGVQLNVTAILTLDQVRTVANAMQNGPESIVSVFAGRIADTGIDPIPLMKEALEILRAVPNANLLWASPREVLNIYQADAIGCHIITATSDLLRKLHLAGKDLSEYSLDTVQMFHDDALKAGYRL
jgi:transaldolase